MCIRDRSYLERVSHITNFHPVGRLAEYRYYDMDAVTASALNLSLIHIY